MFHPQDHFAQSAIVRPETDHFFKRKWHAAAMWAAFDHLSEWADVAGTARALRVRIDGQRLAARGAERADSRRQGDAADVAAVGIKKVQQSAGQAADCGRQFGDGASSARDRIGAGIVS
jgi:hypothetical protein